jgi:hypothetical protein
MLLICPTSQSPQPRRTPALVEWRSIALVLAAEFGGGNGRRSIVAMKVDPYLFFEGCGGADEKW